MDSDYLLRLSRLGRRSFFSNRRDGAGQADPNTPSGVLTLSSQSRFTGFPGG